jgi:putative ABC transport system permease protein
MKVRDLAVETWSALDANRGRSALTVLGIVIGISAVIAMTALIGGINKALVGELGLSQAQLVYISVFTSKPLTYDDVDKMAQNLTDYEYMVATSNGSGEDFAKPANMNPSSYSLYEIVPSTTGNRVASGISKHISFAWHENAVDRTASTHKTADFIWAFLFQPEIQKQKPLRTLK